MLLIKGFHGSLHAQTISRYNIFSYNVNEGLLQSTIRDIAFDNNNFFWISFPNGIQKFDGKNFSSVPVQPGLPEDKFVLFFRCSHGELLISHSQGISKYDIRANRFIQVYNTISPNKKANFIGQSENTVYFFENLSTITGIDCRTFNVLSSIKTGFPDATTKDYIPRISDNIINHKVAFEIGSALYLFDLKKGKILYRSIAIPYISSFFLRLKTENEVWYVTHKINNTLHLYNFSLNSHSVIPVIGKDNKAISRSKLFPWKDKYLLSFSNKLYEYDTASHTLTAEIVDFQNQSVAGPSAINDIVEDNFGNLYITTVSNGIKKIIRNNYAIRYYGTEEKKNNFIVSILPDKKQNRIIAGTVGNGLLIFDTLQHLAKHIKTLPGKKFPFTANIVFKNNKGDYLLFVGGKYVWQLSNDLSQIFPLKISTILPEEKSGTGYFANPLFQNDQEAVTQSQGRLYKTRFADNTITEHEFTLSYTMSGLLYRELIISHANDELIFLDAETFRELKKIPFKNTGYVRCFARDAENKIYVGSNNGLFKIDSTGKILWHLKKENGLPDNCIYAMVFDEQGLLWCSSNKGIFKLNKDNSILQIKKEDGLQENEFNTNAVAKTADGEIFFGGVNGVSSFYPAPISSFEEKINLLFTGIKANNEDVIRDTATWEITSFRLPYNRNSLTFDFIAMASNNPEQYIYQYQMEGIDDQWIQNHEMQTVRYSLPTGSYTFKIYASRFFDKDAKAMKELRIIIQPPFWKTWWFKGSVGILIISILVVGINRFNKNKYQKKLQVLESERKIKSERERISRDLHDSLGAYANAVLYNTELLEQETHDSKRYELMKDLKFASKDIITSLRETVWALNKEIYTAEECLLRIRNFVQPFSRYYTHINFHIEGEAPASVQFHSTRALNLVRIIQEAVSNSMKHAGPQNIYVKSITETGKWKLVVVDDGSGFDYNTAKKLESGNGLSNMQRRANDSGFEFTIQSETGKGTVVTVIAGIL